MQPVLKSAVRKGLRTVGRTAAVQRVLHFYDFYGLIPPWERPLTADQATADILRAAPTEMSQEERAFLFALVRGAKPRRVLEIGTAEGGSSLVMATAMEANGGAGRIDTIDPVPRIQFDPMLLHGRVEVIAGLSPQAIEDAAARADGPFDFILIDGIHIYDQTKRDLDAALRHTAESAYVLLHDAFHYGVSEAIRETVESSPRLHDCGYVCNQPRPVGELATHAGFRLLRVGAEVVDVGPLVEWMWRAQGVPAPNMWSLRNHDFWYCAAIEPCDYCREHAESATEAVQSAG